MATENVLDDTSFMGKHFGNFSHEKYKFDQIHCRALTRSLVLLKYDNGHPKDYLLHQNIIHLKENPL